MTDTNQGVFGSMTAQLRWADGERTSVVWTDGLKDLGCNLLAAWPLFVVFVCLLLASGLALSIEEHLSYGFAVYETWLTMTTVGWLAQAASSNPGPFTAGGEVLTALDALIGLVMFGLLIWIITQSFDRTPRVIAVPAQPSASSGAKSPADVYELLLGISPSDREMCRDILHAMVEIGFGPSMWDQTEENSPSDGHDAADETKRLIGEDPQHSPAPDT